MAGNNLFLYRSPQSEWIVLGVGSPHHKRKVILSDDEALKLAYRLMSLAKGGETQGFEKL